MFVFGTVCIVCIITLFLIHCISCQFEFNNMTRVKEGITIALSRRAPIYVFLCFAATFVVTAPLILLSHSYSATRLLWLIPLACVSITYSLVAYHFANATLFAAVYAPGRFITLSLIAACLGCIAGLCMHMYLWGAISAATNVGSSAVLGAAAFLYYMHTLRPHIFTSISTPCTLRSLVSLIYTLLLKVLHRKTTLFLFLLSFVCFSVLSLGVLTSLVLLCLLLDAALILVLLHPLNFAKLQLLLPPAATSITLLCEVIKEGVPSHLFSPLPNLLTSGSLITSANNKPTWKEISSLLQQYSDSVTSEIEVSISALSLVNLRYPLELTQCHTSISTAYQLAIHDLTSTLRYDSAARIVLYSSSCTADITFALMIQLLHCTLQLQCIVAHMKCAAAKDFATTTTAALVALSEHKRKLLASPFNALMHNAFPAALTASPLSHATTSTLSLTAEALSLMLLQALSYDKHRILHHFLPAALTALCGLSVTLQDFARACNSHQHTLQRSPRTNGRFIDVSNLSLTGVALVVEESINRLVVGYSDVIPSYSFPAEYATLLKNKMTLARQ